MDTCTNCGASLRPGAKFCTTCGTRLNEVTSSSNDGWGTPRPQAQDEAQETRVIEAVKPEETPSFSGRKQASADSWTSAYGSSATTSDDPASRFRTALDNEVQPVEDQPEPSTEDSESTWGTPPSTFTPPPSVNWVYSASTEEQGNEVEEDRPESSGWGTSPGWDTAETDAETPAEVEISEETPAEEETPVETPAQEVDAAGFTDDGDDEVDVLSGDENIEVSGPVAERLAPDDARDKAIALADELRRTIRMMSSGGESDHGAAVMALTEASLRFGDFSDVRGVIADVKNDPRDIQALSALAGKIDRIDALLDEHKSMAESIETAIRELNG